MKQIANKRMQVNFKSNVENLRRLKWGISEFFYVRPVIFQLENRQSLYETSVCNWIIDIYIAENTQ